MNFRNPPLESIQTDFSLNNNVSLDVLRLDQIHPVVSGNKRFKLKYYLQKAAENHKKTIATFGGAYSNHVVATAFAAKESGFGSFAIIRGERPKQLSHTLENAIKYGMQLHFVSRESYTDKEKFKSLFPEFFWIDEGGSGPDGAKGASEILDNIAYEEYSHIITAVGTGTTFAGLIKKIKTHQQAIGISVMKNNLDLLASINSLLNKEEQKKNFILYHDFHFGGYAKKNDALIKYINHIYEQTNIPLDFVYTAKAFYGMQKLIEEKKIPPYSKILFIHTGGLQGNLSLPKDLLKF